MRVIFPFLILTFIYSGPVYSQDERQFREIFSYKREKLEDKELQSLYHYKARSHRYYLDLNQDNTYESFYISKKDGEDWIHFFDSQHKEVFRYQFYASGPWSRLYRVQVRKLGESAHILLLYYFEGVTKYLKFQGTARVYFLTIDGGDLKSMAMKKGPYTWDEQRWGIKEHYHQRKFDVSLFDFDRDNVKEVAVRYGTITRVFKYLGKGDWLEFNDVGRINPLSL